MDNGLSVVLKYTMALHVKYGPYLDSYDLQVENFVYGINYTLRVAVWMWNPTSVAMAVEYARYAEDMSETRGGSKLIGSNKYVLRKAPWSYFRGGQYRPPPYDNRFTPRGNTSSHLVLQESSSTQESTVRAQGSFDQGTRCFRGFWGRNLSQPTPPRSMQEQPNISC